MSETQKSFAKGFRNIESKLRARQICRQTANISCVALMLPLLLCGALFVTVWSELDYPDLTSLKSVLCIFSHAKFAVPLCLLLIIAQLLELLQMRAVFNDCVKYSHVHMSMIPTLWTMIMLAFTAAVWCSMTLSGSDVNIAKLIIIVGGAIVVVTNFFNYYLKILATHLHILSLLGLTENTCPQYV